VRRALQREPTDRRVHLIAAGKAAFAMAEAASETLAASIEAGILVSPDAAARLPRVDAMLAEHPQPGPGSEAAGRRVLQMARAVPSDGLLLVLLSGGASSLMAVPADGVTLAEKRRVTEVLLRSGADIRALNTVRKHLSALKGGRLAASTSALCRTLVLSDVVGDDLSVIASGPTVPDATSFADALDIVERLVPATCPPAVLEYLKRGVRGDIADTPKPGDARLARSVATVIGGRMDAMRGAAEAARARGYHTVIVGEPVIGEARVAGRMVVETALERAKSVPRPVCVISSGETTVTVAGRGRGGRNQELALASVEALAGFEAPAALGSVGTDGVDGPTDAAGATVDTSTRDRARIAGLAEPRTFLEANDSFTFFSQIGDLIRTGPTGTNVGDLQIFLLA
jgi:glycerate 2-kinase